MRASSIHVNTGRKFVNNNNTTCTAIYSLGPDALDWQDLFGPSKNLDKIRHCQISNLSSVGALRHSKMFVDHKYQSHGNNHHCLWLKIEINFSWLTLFFLQIMTCILTNLSDFTPEKNLSCSEAGQRCLWSLVSLDKIWYIYHWAHLSQGTGDRFFPKINKNLPNASRSFVGHNLSQFYYARYFSFEHLLLWKQQHALECHRAMVNNVGYLYWTSNKCSGPD